MSKQKQCSIDISAIKDSLVNLKQIDFELAYLALLTREGLKPLSRWEKPLDNEEINSLEKMNLLTKRITRLVQSGNEADEIIFSRNQVYIDLYAKRFENTNIDKSPETQRFEGFLFGYPPCCIEKYILKPYAANNLDEKDRNILFHWACNNCTITQFLLNSYKKLFDLIENL